MTSSPDERGADRGAPSGSSSSRETLLLRGASAAGAVPYQRTEGAPVWGRRSGRRTTGGAAPAAPSPSPAAPAAAPAMGPAPAVHLPPTAAASTASTVVDGGTRRGAAAGTAGLPPREVHRDPLPPPRAEAPRQG